MPFALPQNSIARGVLMAAYSLRSSFFPTLLPDPTERVHRGHHAWASRARPTDGVASGVDGRRRERGRRMAS
jgi:hypothetical protein